MLNNKNNRNQPLVRGADFVLGTVYGELVEPRIVPRTRRRGTPWPGGIKFLVHFGRHEMSAKKALEQYLKDAPRRKAIGRKLLKSTSGEESSLQNNASSELDALRRREIRRVLLQQRNIYLEDANREDIAWAVRFLREQGTN